MADNGRGPLPEKHRLFRKFLFHFAYVRTVVVPQGDNLPRKDRRIDPKLIRNPEILKESAPVESLHHLAEKRPGQAVLENKLLHIDGRFRETVAPLHVIEGDRAREIYHPAVAVAPESEKITQLARK